MPKIKHREIDQIKVQIWLSDSQGKSDKPTIGTVEFTVPLSDIPTFNPEDIGTMPVAGTPTLVNMGKTRRR